MIRLLNEIFGHFLHKRSVLASLSRAISEWDRRNENERVVLYTWNKEWAAILHRYNIMAIVQVFPCDLEVDDSSFDPESTTRSARFQSFLRPLKVFPDFSSVCPRIANGIRKENKRCAFLVNLASRLLLGLARRLSAYLVFACSIWPLVNDSGMMNQTMKEYMRCRQPST